MRKIILAMSILVVAVFAGCYNDKQVSAPTTTTNPNPNPVSNCDTLVVRYSVEIKNILTANCYSCHSGQASNGGGYKYDVYPGDLVPMAKAGNLVQSITHTGTASPMPKGFPKLTDCDIAKIRWWVKNGAPNN